MTETRNDPVDIIDSYFTSVANRALVSSAEFVDQLLDVHALVDDVHKPSIERYLAEFSSRALLSGTEATDALLDLRGNLVHA